LCAARDFFVGPDVEADAEDPAAGALVPLPADAPTSAVTARVTHPRRTRDDVTELAGTSWPGRYVTPWARREGRREQM
jgi:hypothetical protein